MSASRAMASAKNKKAGGNNPNPAANMQDQKYSPSVGGSETNEVPIISKVTIPQALQMLSCRLDVIEEKSSKAFDVLEESRVLEKQSENKYLVDANVFESLVSRIEKLESTNNSTTPIQQQDSISKNELENVYANMADINNKMDEFKDNFIKLQSYVMDTNAKLTEVVFSIPAESMVDYRDVFIKKTEDLSEPNVALPVHRMTSTPDMSDMVPDMLDPIDASSLERPVLKRSTNEIISNNDGSLKLNINNDFNATSLDSLTLGGYVETNNNANTEKTANAEETVEMPSL
jgi:hypothetical protein